MAAVGEAAAIGDGREDLLIPVGEMLQHQSPAARHGLDVLLAHELAAADDTDAEG